MLTRLEKQPHKPLLPSIFLANVRFPVKLDELKLLIATQTMIRDCCVLLITETWVNPLIPDMSIELAGYTAQDRTESSGKNRGGGNLCTEIPP